MIKLIKSTDFKVEDVNIDLHKREVWSQLCPSVAGDLHRQKLHQALDSSKTNLWYFCHTPVLYLLYTCHINAILLSYICHTPVVYMSYSCHIYVILTAAAYPEQLPAATMTGQWPAKPLHGGCLE